jgi:hypothetical protein
LQPTVALCVICHDRPEELRAALASASDFDEVVVLDMASNPPLAPAPGVTWLRSEENLGVTEGRNRQVRATAADTVVFLDDDAAFIVADAGTRVRATLSAHPEAAVIAFRIQRSTGEVLSAEQPFRGRATSPDTARPCAYFLGGAVAIRRDAFLRAGGYDPRFVYSTEEIDLSFALTRDGWSLWYEPTIRVEHRPSPRGRGLDPQIPALRFRNRVLLARRHLPFPVAVVHTTAWAIRTFSEALHARRVRPWLDAWRAGFRLPVVRQPLGWSSLRLLHRRGGRVLW